MAIDPNGTAWWHWVAGALAIVGAALVIGAITVLTCGVGTLAGTMLGAAIYGAAQGVAIGAAVGVIGGGIIGGIASDWSAEGILTGMGIGLGVCAIIGGVIGGLAGVKSFTANSAYLTKYQHNVKQVLSSFKGNPKLTNVQKGTKAFRVHGGKSNAIGSWVSPKIYSNPVSKLALDPKWGNTASELSTLLFNQDAMILVGKAAAQGALKGGGIQWFLGDTLWLSLFL